MAFSYTTNIVGTGALFIYELKTLLKSVGWTVPRSSDATTYNSSGDQITSGSSGANGMANNSAWFVIRSPSVDGYQREFCFQRGTVNQNWRIKYSHSAGFTGGSPGATQTPSATDEQVLLGSGTDASPTFASFLTTDSTYRGTIWAGGSSESYVFYISWWLTGGTAPVMPLAFERLADNTFSSLDLDPYIIWCSGPSGTLDSINIANVTLGPKCWYKKGYSDESFSGANAFVYQSASANWYASSGTPIGNNAWNGEDDGFPIIFGKTALNSSRANYGLKGISKHWAWAGTNRSIGSTLTVSSSQDKIIISNIIFPWNGTTPVL